MEPPPPIPPLMLQQQQLQQQQPGEPQEQEQQPQPFATPDQVKASEKAALNVHKKQSVQAAPVRQYLESTVVPVVMQGMQAVCKERPDNPVEFLAYYLLSHNPQPSGPKQEPTPKQVQADAAGLPSGSGAPAAFPLPTS